MIKGFEYYIRTFLQRLTAFNFKKLKCYLEKSFKKIFILIKYGVHYIHNLYKIITSSFTVHYIITIRETTGAVRNSRNPRSPSVRPFTRLPGRLAFCLKDAIPQSAIEAGHIFLGFSKCGQVQITLTG